MPEKKSSKASPKNTELTLLQSQIEELTLALQRERADAMNVRRRAEEEKLKMASYYKANVVKQLLAFVDSFDKALAQTPKDLPANKPLEEWLKGLSGINKQLWQAMDAIGVTKIDTVGHEFDPRFHEAVQMDSEGGGTKEIITEEFVSGFKIDDEVIRHAMVKVALQ